MIGMVGRLTHGKYHQIIVEIMMIRRTHSDIQLVREDECLYNLERDVFASSAHTDIPLSRFRVCLGTKNKVHLSSGHVCWMVRERKKGGE